MTSSEPSTETGRALLDLTHELVRGTYHPDDLLTIRNRILAIEAEARTQVADVAELAMALHRWQGGGPLHTSSCKPVSLDNCPSQNSHHWLAERLHEALATPPTQALEAEDGPQIEGWGPVHNPIPVATQALEAPAHEHEFEEIDSGTSGGGYQGHPPDKVCKHCGFEDRTLEAPALPQDAALLALWTVLDMMADNDECRFDHHGYCQAHLFGAPEPGDPPCLMQKARAILKDSEPTAKALRDKPPAVTRFEAIDHRTEGTGRVFVANPCTVELAYQDDGRTLKVFVQDAK